MWAVALQEGRREGNVCFDEIHICEISDSRGDKHEDGCLLGCCVVWSGRYY